MRITYRIALALGLLMVFMANDAPADQGTVPKWSQAPVDGEGENIPSTIDWRDMGPNPEFNGVLPNWNIADDFRSDGRPILTVRWWGSYLDPIYEPQDIDGTLITVEDTFVLSFFEDIPFAPPDIPFSRPGDLLGTYVAPVMAVRILPTPMVGWDGHRIWEYEVNLQDTHLDHGIPGLSDPISFNENEGIIYWLSITASNGHELIINPTGEWTFEVNSDPPLDNHWWGWHTSPNTFNDVPTMSTLAMGALGEWNYLNWSPAQQLHLMPPEFNPNDMAFELLTIPIPGALWLFAPALAGLAMLGRRNIA